MRSGDALRSRAGAKPVSGSARRRWVAACIVGELIGFVPPALVGGALVASDAPESWLVVGLVLAGIAEGYVLGSAQDRVLRDVIPGVTKWPEATAAAAGVAWLAGMGGSSLLQARGSWWLVLVAPGWVLGLLAMGVLQAWRLSGVRDGWAGWIPVTSIAWLVGVTIPVVALSAIPNGWHVMAHVVVGVVAATAMGATVGVITGHRLVKLAGERVLSLARADGRSNVESA